MTTRSRIVIAASATLGIAASMLLTAAPAHASACPLDFDCRVTYYSDSDRTEAVGGEWTACDGHTSTWGTKGPYRTHDRIPC